jgi:hypothetical protein
MSNIPSSIDEVFQELNTEIIWLDLKSQAQFSKTRPTNPAPDASGS